MKRCIVIFTLLLAAVSSRAQDGLQQRQHWVETLTRISDPVLRQMAAGKLRATMPVETLAGGANPSNARTTHLEALGRTVAGIAPWLELGPDRTPEGRLRKEYTSLTCKAISQGVDPSSPDFLNFTVTRQPLVDAAFLCHGLVRAPGQLWGNLDARTRRNFITAMDSIRRITPPETNWLLFAAMVEAAMLDLTGDWNPGPVHHALDRFKQWYAGDGWYGDGAQLHMDHYNSFVIHPMLYDILRIMHKHGKGYDDMFEAEKARITRYAVQQEAKISPDGAYPVLGRSIAYRFGVFQALSQAALQGNLGSMPPAAVRCGLDAVITRHMAVEGNFDAKGWLTLGFCGHQPELAERYISTGSLYLCTTAFLALGLPSTDAFWTSPAQPWSGKRAWSGDRNAVIDKALKD